MVSRIFSILKGEFFMSLFEQINKDYVTAYKAKDTQRVSVLRMLKASVKNRLVDLCRPGGTLTDEEMMDVILKEGKQRRDSIAEYGKGHERHHAGLQRPRGRQETFAGCQDPSFPLEASLDP